VRVFERICGPCLPLAPDAVVHMGYRQAKLLRSREALEKIEKDHGVTSAADGDEQMPGLRRQATQGGPDEGEEVLGI